jgi:hypothetical protein
MSKYIKKTDDEILDGRHLRRLTAEDKFLGRQEKLAAAAKPLIGELCRDGQTIYYVLPGHRSYRESTSYTDLVNYLARNKYITAR